MLPRTQLVLRRFTVGNGQEVDEMEAGTEPVKAEVTRVDIIRGLRDVGLGLGAAVLMHSSLSSMGHVDGGADAVISALLEVVGPDGLASVPTHTWGTVNARQPVFHVRLSPSIVGQITEVFRHRPDALRSRHPTHSVAAIGRRSAEYVRDHELAETPCGRESPYGRLCAWGGYVLFLGVQLNTWTLMHAFEEWAPVPWIFNRWEHLYTVLEDGTVIPVPSRRHNPDPDCRRDYLALEPLLQRHGLIRYGRIGDATLRLVDAAGAERLLLPRMREDSDLVLKRRSRPVV